MTEPDIITDTTTGAPPCAANDHDRGTLGPDGVMVWENNQPCPAPATRWITVRCPVGGWIAVVHLCEQHTQRITTVSPQCTECGTVLEVIA